MARGIVQVNTSPGGVPKRPVAQVQVDLLGLSGDDHDDLVHHGGPDPAVSLLPIERIEALAGEGHPIAAGSVGENITTRGIDWDAVQPGARLRLGAEVVIEITSFAAPCRTIRAAFRGGDSTASTRSASPAGAGPTPASSSPASSNRATRWSWYNLVADSGRVLRQSASRRGAFQEEPPLPGWHAR